MAMQQKAEDNQEEKSGTDGTFTRFNLEKNWGTFRLSPVFPRFFPRFFPVFMHYLVLVHGGLGDD